MIALPHFYRKWFQLRHSKICKNLKNALFKRSQHSLMNLRLLQNYFLRMLLCPNFDLNSFYHFARKSFQLCHSKICKKTEKCALQTFRTFVFELKVAPKPFSKNVLMPKLNRFEHFTSLSRKTVSTSSFQKFAKSWKMPFSNAQNIRFWAQGSFKTIF